jgi:hypothetical protein
MILNLTQHLASPDQVAAGVIDLAPELRAKVAALLTFEALPDAAELFCRASDLAELVADTPADQPICFAAMIGGAPYFMAPLADALRKYGIEPSFSFTARESVDVAQPDGSVRKTAVFRHLGWVPA